MGVDELGQIRLVTFGVSGTLLVNPDGGDFAAAQPFYDAAALGELARICYLGCLSSGNFQQLFTVQKKLGVLWDVVELLADAAPGEHRTAAWQRAVTSITKQLQLKPAAWLHVSSHVAGDLAMAKEFGIMTGFVPRPGGTPAVEAEHLPADLMVSDLYQLHEALVQARGRPVRYTVQAETVHAKVAKEFVRWMRQEHGAEVMAAPGCWEFRVYRVSDTIVSCEYLFRNRTDLENYYSNLAPALREKGRTAFPEQLVQFSRREEFLEVEGHLRK